MNTTEERLWTYADSYGVVGPDKGIVANVLVKEVQNEYSAIGKDAPNEAEVYQSLVETAEKFGVSNPFSDAKKAFKVFSGIRNMDITGWEKAIDFDQRYNKRMTLPAGALVNLFAERLKAEPETVLIAEAEKFVPKLKRIIDKNYASSYTLTTQNPIYAAAFRYIFEGYENVEIVETDIYKYGFLDKRFDYIMACPAFGMRNLVEDPNFICKEYEAVAFENLLLHLNGYGRLAIVLPGRVTFAAGRTKSLREFVQTNYTIKEIAELPSGTLSRTGIKTYMVEVENTRPEDDDIVVIRYTAGERKSKSAVVTKLEVEEETFIMLPELIEQESWSVDRIFAQQDKDYLEFRDSNMRKDLLENVAQVFRGKAVNRKDPSGRIGVVNIANIGDYEIDYDSLDHLEEEDRKVQNYILQDGDVLLPARGTAIRTAIFREQGYPIIASANVIVIRPDKKMLDPTYLKIFLDSPIGNKIISGAQQGMVVMNISYKDLKVLEIPVPPMKEQNAVSSEYSNELERYRKTVAEAEARWNEVLSKLQNF